MEIKTLFFGLVVVLLLAGAVNAENCEEKVKIAEDYLEQGDYNGHRWAQVYFDQAAHCYKDASDMENAKKYYIKAGDAQFFVAEYDAKKGDWNEYNAYGEYGTAAEYYADGVDYEKAKKAYFTIIEHAKSAGDYSKAGTAYIGLASMYDGELNDKSKACEYCGNADEYKKKAGEGDAGCDLLFGCESSSTGKTPKVAGGDTSESSSGGNAASDELPIIPIAIVAVILIIAAAVFLIKRKK